MAKPRKRKATKTTAKRKGKRPAKRSPSRRNAVTSDDECIDVFIPKRRASVVASVAATADDDESVAVFVARRGRPIEVQDDWTDRAASAPLGISNDEYFASLTPRAMTPGGWTADQLREHALVVNPKGIVECRYGCVGSTSNIPGVSMHSYACEYWRREGKHRTPFD